MKNKLFIRAYTQHIIQLASGKLEVEVWRVKIKSAIIKYEIPARRLIQHPDGIVTEGAIQFITRITCQEAYAVILGICAPYGEECSKNEEQGDDPKIRIITTHAVQFQFDKFDEN